MIIKGSSQFVADPVMVYLSLGANLGSRKENLDRALNLLSHRLTVGKVSQVYETDPVDNVNQPKFLNLACQIFTRLAPVELLTLVKGVELKLGRVSTGANASRPIDIDIIFYGDQVVETPELIIPHPRMAQRAFVLIPLAEIAPDMVHQVSKKTVKELLAGIKETQGVFEWKVD